MKIHFLRKRTYFFIKIIIDATFIIYGNVYVKRIYFLILRMNKRCLKDYRI